jgi:hypothetical protein
MATTNNGGELTVTSPQGREVIPGLGMSGMAPGDIALPRIALTQGLSQVVASGDAAVGIFYNVLTREAIGPGFDFVPIISFQNRVYFKVGTGLSCRSVDTINGQGNPGGLCDACDLKDWPADGSGGPPCSVSHNWLGLMVGRPTEKPSGGKNATIAIEPCQPEIVVVQWRSTATATAKALNGLHLNASLLTTERQWWHRRYRIGVKRDRNPKGEYYSPTIRPMGSSTAEERKVAQTVAAMLSSRTLAFEEEKGVDPDASTTEARAEARDGGQF